MLPLPHSLQELITAGKWPRIKTEAIRQNLTPLVTLARIQLLAPTENSLYLLPPPFYTVAQRASGNKFWLGHGSAPSEIDFDLALDIADFGLGSDSPILLDYRTSKNNPRVLHLRWSNRGKNNHWVELAPNFDAFASILGLLPIQTA